jgi:acyl dehydratase
MDVQVGTRIPAWRVASVDAEKMKTMAVLLRDPNPIHFDVEAVRRLGMGDRVVNQGPNNMAYVVNMLLAWTRDPAALRALQVRFLANVFAGDGLVAAGEVTALREERGVPVADCDVWLDRDDGTRVLSGTATVALAVSSSTNRLVEDHQGGPPWTSR